MDTSVEKFAIIDFEASGLMEGSFPVEVAWAGEALALESHLIRPTGEWLRDEARWCVDAEQMHGLTRERLRSEGEDPRAVARRLASLLGEPDRRVYSDNPAFDARWLAVLWEAAGLAGTPVPILSLDEHLTTLADADTLAGAYHMAYGISPPTHRAGRDVEYLMTVYRICEEYRSTPA